MSSKIVKILNQTPGTNHPVILENFETYLEPRQHDMKCLLARDPTVSKVGANVGNMVLVSGEKQLYTGRMSAESDEDEPADLLRTYVARRNKDTGKMRLYEVRSTMLQHISQDQPMQDGPDPVLDNRQLARMQGKFNPRAARRELKMQNKRMDMSMMEEKLKRTIAETVVKESPAEVVEPGLSLTGDSIGEALQRELLAKSNPEAKSLRDLYRAERLVGGDEWRKLIEPARQLLQVPAEELHMVNAYLENKVKAAMQSSEPADEPNLTTVRICLYMDVLARLIGRQGYMLASSRGSVSPFTNQLDGPIRQCFLQAVGNETSLRNQVTKYTRMKAILYYMALGFALESKDVLAVDTLHRSLEVPRQQLLMYGRVVGARYNPKLDQFVLGTVQQKAENEPLMDVLAALKSGGKRSRRN